MRATCHSIPLALLALVGSALPPACAEIPTAEQAATETPARLALVPFEPLPVPLPPVDHQPDDTRLSMAEAESLALASHPTMREAAAELRAARGNWLQVGLRPNPAIGYAAEEIGDEGTAGKQGGYFSQEFVTANKLGLNRAVASREVAAAEQRVEIARLQLLSTVRTQYIELLASKRQLELSRQLATIAAQSVEASELRLEALDIPRVSLLQSQVESESAAVLEQQAQERYAAAWRALGTTLGIETPERFDLDDTLARSLPEVPWISAKERLLADSPELIELRFAVDGARWAVQRASAGRVPNVTAQAGAQYDDATDTTIANVQVSMPIPIFDRNQGAIAEAMGELAAARAALERKQVQLEQRLAVALRDYETARARVSRYSEKVLPLAYETLELTAAGYREGELDFLSVLTVQQTYAQKSLAYLEALEAAWKQWALIDNYLVGTLLDDPN